MRRFFIMLFPKILFVDRFAFIGIVTTYS